MLCIGNLKLNNRLIMAPMAGITNLPFRHLVKKMGAALVFTEMISAMGLTRGQRKTYSYLKSNPFEKPLAVQIFGNEPEVMANAAEIAVSSGANIVDINMGCPVRKIVKTGAGGALLRVPRELKRIVTAVRRVCSVPLTVKMRAGWSPGESNTIELARQIEDCGADAITLHPRFVNQGFTGEADWRIIADLKTQMKVPIIGNGDIVSPHQALQMKNQTGCDGVMIGRGAIGNPWIFRQILNLENGEAVRPPQLDERKNLIEEHFRLLSFSEGEFHAARMMRSCLLWYTKGLPNSCRFRENITSIIDFDTMRAALEMYFLALQESDI